MQAERGARTTTGTGFDVNQAKAKELLKTGKVAKA
jgi:hypothetical protein